MKLDKLLRVLVLQNTSGRLLLDIGSTRIATKLSEIRSVVLIVKGRKALQNKLQKCVIWCGERPILRPETPDFCLLNKSIGVPPLDFVLVCKIHIYMLKLTFSSLLT